ncbi:hypothetical protein MTYP_00360 [Methylophilaceae bacterium]|nr:hypothetical protein MTYP_00360 [Methylophilaceae bacterium]
MRRRLEFIFPDVRTARHAWKEMLLACIDNRHIHFIAKPGINLGKMLHRANVLETTDAIHEGERGILYGSGLGLLAGLMALAFPPWYTDLHWVGILAITTFSGAVAGAFWLAMLGVNFINSDLDAVKARIEQGEIMMIVSVPLKRVEEICQLVDRLHLHGQYHDAWPARHQIFP